MEHFLNNTIVENLILNGREAANDLYAKLPNMGGKELSIILIGDDNASEVYSNSIVKACSKVGLKGTIYKFNPHDYGDIEDLADAIESKIIDLNCDHHVAGIMIQHPYLEELKKYDLENFITEQKDIDGLTLGNMHHTLNGQVPCHYPATPKGIMALLDYYDIPVEGRNVVIIGRSETVGKPLAAMMLARDATVVICHSKTRRSSLKLHLSMANIIISAVGKPHFLTRAMIDDGLGSTNIAGVNPIIIDAGINRDENGKLCGDVEYDSVLSYTSAITPVPDGVGPMTVYSLIENCCHKQDIDKEGSPHLV